MIKAPHGVKFGIVFYTEWVNKDQKPVLDWRITFYIPLIHVQILKKFCQNESNFTELSFNDGVLAVFTEQGQPAEHPIL